MRSNKPRNAVLKKNLSAVHEENEEEDELIANDSQQVVSLLFPPSHDV
jgi:hypothetical protein